MKRRSCVANCLPGRPAAMIPAREHQILRVCRQRDLADGTVAASASGDNDAWISCGIQREANPIRRRKSPPGRPVLAHAEPIARLPRFRRHARRSRPQIYAPPAIRFRSPRQTTKGQLVYVQNTTGEGCPCRWRLTDQRTVRVQRRPAVVGPIDRAAHVRAARSALADSPAPCMRRDAAALRLFTMAATSGWPRIAAPFCVSECRYAKAGIGCQRPAVQAKDGVYVFKARVRRKT